VKILFWICRSISDGLYVFLILLMALRESVKIMVRAFILTIDFAVKIVQELWSLHMNSVLFQVIAVVLQTLNIAN